MRRAAAVAAALLIFAPGVQADDPAAPTVEVLTQPGKILSLSTWRDEEVVRAWRNVEEHRRTQKAARETIFAEYRLRVAQVLRDYGLHERAQSPDDSRAAHG